MIFVFYATAVLASLLSALIAFFALTELNLRYRNWWAIAAASVLWMLAQTAALWCAFTVGFLA